MGERGVERELDKVVQFKRLGFVRIDGVSGDGVAAYFYAWVKSNGRAGLVAGSRTNNYN